MIGSSAAGMITSGLAVTLDLEVSGQDEFSCKGHLTRIWGESKYAIESADCPAALFISHTVNPDVATHGIARGLV